MSKRVNPPRKSKAKIAPKTGTALACEHNNRSKITNGHPLPGVHLAKPWARRFRDLLELHLSDLGGADNCSEGEKALVRRAATLIVELEQMEIRFASTGSSPSALDNYVRLTNTLKRVLESLGLKRRMKNVKTLGDLLLEHGDAA